MNEQPAAAPTSDHDLLIILWNEMKNIKNVLKDIQDGTVKIQDDHETRLRDLEKAQETLNGKILVVSAVSSIVITFIIGAALKKFGL